MFMLTNAWKQSLLAGGLCLCLASYTFAGVSPEEAAKLKTTLTPMGAERAGNADGTIPAWTGGYTTVDPNYKAGGRRGDPFASDKPLFSITAKNMNQYADKLTDGTKALFKKYPDSYRLDIYQTRRTASAPQWFYDNTFKNASRGTIAELPSGPTPKNVFGGVPFPIPKTGAEVMWNHLLHWSGVDWTVTGRAFVITADGRTVLSSDSTSRFSMPYYYKELGSPEEYIKRYDGKYWRIRMMTNGPPIRLGEAITGQNSLDDDKTQSWVYLTGQRRVRMLPNPCCDTPTPASAGVMSFDEVGTFAGRLDRFNWKLLGKKEMYIPYNTNKLFLPTKVSEFAGKHFLNPDYLRWELHRVWVVEATLKTGHRHPAVRSLYYVDEDSWMGVIGDRWDAKGQIWKQLWALPVVLPDMPGVTFMVVGFNDLTSGTWFVANVEDSVYSFSSQHFPDSIFTGAALGSESVR
jgi:hypothetical protein